AADVVEDGLAADAQILFVMRVADPDDRVGKGLPGAPTAPMVVPGRGEKLAAQFPRSPAEEPVRGVLGTIAETVLEHTESIVLIRLPVVVGGELDRTLQEI